MSMTVVRAGWVTWHLNSFPWSALFRLSRKLDTVFPAPNKKYLFTSFTKLSIHYLPCYINYILGIFTNMKTIHSCFAGDEIMIGKCAVKKLIETKM